MTTPAYAPVSAPPVVTWFKVYAAVMCLLYLLMIGAGALFLFFPDQMGEEDAWLVGIIFVIVALPLLVIFAASLFLPPRPWVWIYDIVLICLGFTSCLTLPFCIALLIFWLKPETKVYFGRTP